MSHIKVHATGWWPSRDVFYEAIDFPAGECIFSFKDCFSDGTRFWFLFKVAIFEKAWRQRADQVKMRK
jgi:hypothetical protein